MSVARQHDSDKKEGLLGFVGATGVKQEIHADGEHRLMVRSTPDPYACVCGVDGYFIASGTGIGLSGLVFPSGAFTLGVDTGGFTYKTFYWYSIDSSGALAIEVQDPLNGWFGYDTMAFTSGTLASYIMTAQARRVRLANESGMSGTVTAWYVMRC